MLVPDGVVSDRIGYLGDLYKIATAAERHRGYLEELASLRSHQAALADGLASLSVDQRKALQLRIVEERSYAELASTLGITEQTARARVSRALRALAKATICLEGTPDYA